MLAEMNLVGESLQAVLPATLLLVVGCVFYGMAIRDRSTSKPDETRRASYAITALVALLVTALLGFFRYGSERIIDTRLFNWDVTSEAGLYLTLLGVSLVVLIGWRLAPVNQLPEYYGSLLIMAAGVVLVGAASDLIVLFLGLELVSIPTTVLLALSKRDELGREATLKYFTLSAFSSGFFLFGASYLYGVTGSTDLAVIQRDLGSSQMAFVGMALLLAGASFRITAVPFHYYAPDVFSGATLSLAAILAYVPKVAGFLAIVRVLGGAQLNIQSWDVAFGPLIAIAIVTMTAGNFLAVIQTSIRRMLAYSSVAHSGYLLFGIVALLSTSKTARPIFDYLGAYALMTLGVFAALAALESKGKRIETISDLRGVGSKHPWLALSLAIFMLSLIGMPLTAGFWAKLQLFVAATGSANEWIRYGAIIMAVNAAVAAVYYLATLVRIYEKGEDGVALGEGKLDSPSVVACAICSVVTVIGFFVPTWL